MTNGSVAYVMISHWLFLFAFCFCDYNLRDYHNVIIKGKQGFDKHYRLTKKYGRKKLLKEFPKKIWGETKLKKVFNKINGMWDTKRKQGSGRP